ncbi:MAG: cytochrome c oxidase subunit II [Desulfofustis sp.]|nr:cytochrome c oxidase subunit II [Desulfofustis sp.]MBT8345661.1 cytochrome c oxidase subunit II [Desulfofustis sp.]MBT8355705.1 cytochrome c oxidase subunit II [Desulfofustis sp.]NNF46655.1 cytochrome c oxidase subunit II [Desulfofustis sp.]
MDPVRGVDLAFWYILGISVLLLIAITVVMIYFVIRYRRSKHPEPADIRDNLNLEVVWTVLPTLIALTMFWVGWKSYIGLRDVPEDALEIEVAGQMYSWIFLYPNEKETEGELVVPLGKAVKLNIESWDVLHSFYIPSYRIKVDAVPGMATYAWFMADKVGEYDIFCTEYCGIEHAYMLAKLKIVPEQEYLTWLETEE